ncbi:MAG: HAMP domain-containing protein [Aliidongia sp.]
MPIDGRAHVANIAPSNHRDAPAEMVRVVETRLSDGNILVVARYSEEVERLSPPRGSALELGLIPAMALSLLVGLFMSWRAQKRVKEVNVAAARIMRGNLRERLPVRGSRDDFDQLAISVNRMLDEIARLLDEVKATGDEIAHDLRTPLTRVRARLENAMRKPARPGELEAVIERSIQGSRPEPGDYHRPAADPRDRGRAAAGRLPRREAGRCGRRGRRTLPADR